MTAFSRFWSIVERFESTHGRERTLTDAVGGRSDQNDLEKYNNFREDITRSAKEKNSQVSHDMSEM